MQLSWNTTDDFSKAGYTYNRSAGKPVLKKHSTHNPVIYSCLLVQRIKWPMFDMAHGYRYKTR